jgi:hypothetical protein
VSGESGDGGITDEERRTLQAYPWIQIVTIAGNSFSAPNEEPALVAGLVVEALRSSGMPRSNRRLGAGLNLDLPPRCG